MVTPSAGHAVIVHQATVSILRPAHAPDKRSPQRIFAATLNARMKHGMVYLDAGVLQFERHHVQNVFTLRLLGDQALGMTQPRRRG